MSAHSITLDDLPRDGERLDLAKFSKLNGLMFILGALGTVISALYLFGVFGPDRQAQFAYSWLFAFFFYFTITCGGIFWVMLQHAINAGWSVAIRRLFENLGANIKWLAFFAIPLVFSPPIREALWEWIAAHREAAAHAGAGESLYDSLHHMAYADPHLHLLVAKFGYLNMPFWTARAIFYFVVLGALAVFLRRWSIQQDTDGKFSHTFRSRSFCCLLLLPYALTVTFAAVDWIMAMDYSWFSTMWGVYIFAGCAWSSMAVTIITLTYLRSNGYLGKVVTEEHYHLMGKLLFAFTVFWAYIAFSQFFLIWYANITEETRFYLTRNTGGWWFVSNLLVWGHFAATFVVLLSAGRKKKPVLMSWICVWILFMHVVDIYWLIMPERAPSLTHGESIWIDGAVWGDLFAFIGIGGLLGWATLRRLAKASLYPCRDPRLLESVTVKS
ncbi:hypothetical protein FEM03_13665 [Phragmitibacter flavus]|uniref:Quinol:cytochrome C oxidoreductase n=1 Tax=Phragmitibacter flavus TaxID=2576071 RepID=A0A5R8KD43_9BACT|nr:hypothetical protein [Phragmitibacter flavus]TLD70228.1 hypothetical protein FEM03_13665 [Phragmitibacter flavus]